MQTAKTRRGLWGLVLMSGMLATSALASNWTNDADGNWNTAGNWTGGVPNAIGAVAGLAVPAGITADRSVTLDTNAIVGTLTFSDAAAPANSWTVAQGGANALTFDVSSSTATVTVNQGIANRIAVPVTAADPTIVTVATGANLEISGNITSSQYISKRGSGTLRLSGNNSGWTSQLYINTAPDASGTDAGTIEVTNANSLGSVNLRPMAYSETFRINNVSGGPLTLPIGWTPYNGGTQVLNLGGADMTFSGTWNNPDAYVKFIPDPGVTITFSGTITGAGTNGLNGGSFVLANNASARTGSWYVDPGTRVGIAADNPFGTSAITIQNLNYSGEQEYYAVGGPRSVTGTFQLPAYNYSTNIVRFSGSNDLTFTGNISWWQNDGNPTWLVTNTGLTTFAGNLLLNPSRPQYIKKQGPGTLALTGTNTTTFGTQIDEGALRAQDGTGLSPNSFLTLNGGVLETTGTFARTLGASGGTSFRWFTNGGGFAAQGGPLSVNVNGGGADNLVWASTANFVPNGAPLIFGSVTATGAVTFQDNIDLNTAVRTIRVLDNAGSATDKAVIAGIISGTGVNSGMIKDGAGILELTMTNSYQGATTVSGGKLTVTSTGSINSTSGITLNGGELNYNSATALTKPITFTSGKLSGTGTIATGVTVGSGAVINPGNSPGLQSYTSGLTWNGGGTYQWEINAKTGTAGTDWDKINVTGGLTLGATSGNPFNLSVMGLAGVGTAPLVYMTWPALTFDTLSGGFDPSKFSLTASGFDGSWSPYNWRVLNVGNDVLVMYLPEPTSLVLLAGAGLCVLRRRRT